MSESVLVSRVLAGAGVRHGFSTRLGGVSGGVFASLNLGNPSDLPKERRDPLTNISRNFGVVLGEIGCRKRELVQVHQVHAGDVLVVRPGLAAHGARGDTKADAVVSDDAARVLCVRVADCAPVLIASRDGRVVAAVHAGWRGVIAGVVPNAVREMRGLGATGLAAAVGPCIGVEHFEVGDEVAARFDEEFGTDAGVVARREGRKPRVDLRRALAIQLGLAGVHDVEMVGGCTFADPGRFFSHRRDKGVTGRTGAFIGAA